MLSSSSFAREAFASTFACSAIFKLTHEEALDRIEELGEIRIDCALSRSCSTSLFSCFSCSVISLITDM